MATEKFHWTSESGVEITLPHMRNIPTGLIRKNRNTDELGLMFAVIEDSSDDKMLAKVDALPWGEMENLVEAWTSEVKPGESSRSSNS